MIITYSGHGGIHCADHLKTIPGLMEIRVTNKMVAIAFPGVRFRVKCLKGQELGLDASNDGKPRSKHQDNHHYYIYSRQQQICYISFKQLTSRPLQSQFIHQEIKQSLFTKKAT